LPNGDQLSVSVAKLVLPLFLPVSPDSEHASTWKR